MNLPEKIKEMIADESYDVDSIGQSGSSVLIFSDKVLKIQECENETESEICILKWLQGKLPVPEEELVLSHGDFCLPNIFLQGENVTGYIDMGRGGIADKWCDIALCYRSLAHNFSGKYKPAGLDYPGYDEGMLFEELGIQPDWEKIRYYILLDELF